AGAPGAAPGPAWAGGPPRREPVPDMRITAVGYGAGDRVLADRPNLLRILVGEPVVAAGSDEVVVLETTIDDMNPQLYEHVLERLLAAGAREAFLVPVVMKKSRPGTMLRVLAAPADRERLATIVLAETSSIGLRWTTWRRAVLPRECRTVDTPYGPVRVKLARAPDGTMNVAPEFEDCRRLATERGVPLKLVHQAALVAAVAALRCRVGRGGAARPGMHPLPPGRAPGHVGSTVPCRHALARRLQHPGRRTAMLPSAIAITLFAAWGAAVVGVLAGLTAAISRGDEDPV